MIELQPDLLRRLKRLKIRVEEPGPDMILLRNVPADPRRFNKPHTNLLVGRGRPGMPSLIGVDADLEYLGEDSELIRLFAAAHRQQGWRLFFLGGDSWAAAVEQALGLLGSPPLEAPQQPQLAAASPQKSALLESFAVDFSELVRQGRSLPTVGRAEQIERICVSLAGWQARLPLIVAESGVGKTNLLHALARRLAELPDGRRLLQVNLGVLMAGTTLESERDNLLAALLREASRQPSIVLALDHLEQAVALAPRGRFLLAQALEFGARLIGALSPDSLNLVQVPPLARRLDVIELAPLDPGLTREALEALRPRIERHHNVQIDPAILRQVVDRALSLAGALPEKAVMLLDAAAARAALSGAECVDLYHVYSAAADFPES